MKLLGRDIDARALLDRVQGQLRARGLLERGDDGWVKTADDPLAVEPLSYNLTGLEQTADPLQPLRREVSVLERAARRVVRPLLTAVLGTQRAFNGHVRDSYAQLSAEVLRLRAEVQQLKAAAAVRPDRPEPGVKRRRSADSAGDRPDTSAKPRRRSPARRTPKQR